MYVPNNTNVAYDLSAFEIDERSEKRAKNREQQIKVKTTSVAKSGNALKILFGVACAAVMCSVRCPRNPTWKPDGVRKCDKKTPLSHTAGRAVFLYSSDRAGQGKSGRGRPDRLY